MLGGGIFFLVASTSSHYGLTWDEPNYFYASDLHVQWLAELIAGVAKRDLGTVLSDERIHSLWRWDPYHVPHPPFSRILSGLTREFFSSFVDKFIAYRLAPALFFALLVTAMYLWMTSLFNRATGIFSALTLAVIPNLFGFAHFAVTDMPLTAMWFFTAYCFWKGLKDWRWSFLLGVVWGLALSTKFPALVIPIPLLLWAHLYHRPLYANNLFSMVFLSPVIMVASQPYLWHQTSRRILEFLYDGLSRGYRPDTNFAVYFFNRLYYTSELPWYYPFFITGVTLPEPILVLIFVGLLGTAWLKPQRGPMILFLSNAVFILVMGLLPGAVLHDGMRQLLPVLPFLAGLAGCGFFLLARCLTNWSQRTVGLQAIENFQAKLIGTFSLLLLFPPALDLFAYHPYELSYYNRIVGGIRGAYQRGLEVTYFMEALNPEFLRLLNEKLPPNAVINAFLSNFMLTHYQREGRLRQDIRISDDIDVQYWILLTRLSSFGEDAHARLKKVRPYDAYRLDGVPLVSIYKLRERR